MILQMKEQQNKNLTICRQLFPTKNKLRATSKYNQQHSAPPPSILDCQ